MTDTIKIIIGVVIALCLVDVASYSFWKLSGQTPTDNFYLGTATAHLLSDKLDDRLANDDGFNGRNYTPYNKFNPE